MGNETEQIYVTLEKGARVGVHDSKGKLIIFEKGVTKKVRDKKLIDLFNNNDTYKNSFILGKHKIKTKTKKTQNKKEESE